MRIARLNLIQVFFLFASINAYSSGYVLKTHDYTNKRFHSSAVCFQTVDTTIEPAKSSTIIAPGAKVQLVSNQFSFTEGPAANKKGVVFFFRSTQ